MQLNGDEAEGPPDEVDAFDVAAEDNPSYGSDGTEND
jgi:hypothetical protein